MHSIDQRSSLKSRMVATLRIFLMSTTLTRSYFLGWRESEEEGEKKDVDVDDKF